MTRLAPLIAVVAVVLSGPAARGQSTWTGAVGTDWNAADNWNPSGVPNSTSAAVNFTGTALGTVNIVSSVQALSLTFSNPTGNYTLMSNAGQTLSLNAFV